MPFSKKSYEIVKTKPDALTWEVYETELLAEWQELLSNPESYKESDFHSFFEKHPSMLPKPYDVFMRGAHGPFPSAIISCPTLPGLNCKIPDFIWLTQDSSAFFVILIEIEDPKKQWATQNGQPRAELTQAINQIKDWKAWFLEPNNKEIFIREYGIPSGYLRSKAFIQKYILIYGRRNDPTLTPEFNKKRVHYQGENEVFMTFDRLSPNRDLSNCLSVKMSSGKFKAIHIPPTLTLSPLNADHLAMISNREQAVNRNAYIGSERKDFLNSRWSYWDEWVKKEKKGIISTSDCE